MTISIDRIGRDRHLLTTVNLVVSYSSQVNIDDALAILKGVGEGKSQRKKEFGITISSLNLHEIAYDGGGYMRLINKQTNRQTH